MSDKPLMQQKFEEASLRDQLLNGMVKVPAGTGLIPHHLARTAFFEAAGLVAATCKMCKRAHGMAVKLNMPPDVVALKFQREGWAVTGSGRQAVCPSCRGVRARLVADRVIVTDTTPQPETLPEVQPDLTPEVSPQPAPVPVPPSPVPSPRAAFETAFELLRGEAAQAMAARVDGVEAKWAADTGALLQMLGDLQLMCREHVDRFTQELVDLRAEIAIRDAATPAPAAPPVDVPIAADPEPEIDESEPEPEVTPEPEPIEAPEFQEPRRLKPVRLPVGATTRAIADLLTSATSRAVLRACVDGEWRSASTLYAMAKPGHRVASLGRLPPNMVAKGLLESRDGPTVWGVTRPEFRITDLGRETLNRLGEIE